MKIITSYFDFTKGERNASFILIAAILIALLLPIFLKPDPPAATNFSAFLSMDSGILDNTDKLELELNSKTNHQEILRFKFDPNVITKDSLLLLGFKPYLAERLVKFRNSGAKFKRSEDLKRLYGIDTNIINSLIPYMYFQNKQIENRYQISHRTIKDFTKPSLILELNSADSNQLKDLPWIGSKLALRIISFREKLGGFYSIEQLSEVYGLRDETIEMIKSKLSVDSKLIRGLDINHSDVQVLGKHPYLGYKRASILVNYRNQHGNYTDIGSLEKALGLGFENIEKLKFYINYL